MHKEKQVLWKNKRCPKCGGGIDRFGTCRKCGRPWSLELEKDEKGNIVEEALGLEPGQQHESVVKTVGNRKPRQTRFTKTKEQLEGKKFIAFGEELPPQFATWAINESDNEDEIYRKRSLMRLDSRKIYNQMGLSVRAQESSKATLLWISKLWGFLELEEQQALAPVLKQLSDAFERLTLVRQSKIIQATKMEKAMEKAYAQARNARMKAQEEQKKKEASKLPEAEQDSEGLGLSPIALDPNELMEQVREKLLNLDKSKTSTKSKKFVKSEETPEDAE